MVALKPLVFVGYVLGFVVVGTSRWSSVDVITLCCYNQWSAEVGSSLDCRRID